MEIRCPVDKTIVWDKDYWPMCNTIKCKMCWNEIDINTREIVNG